MRKLNNRKFVRGGVTLNAINSSEERQGGASDERVI